MRQITKMVFVLVCILAISSLGIGNATTTWKPFKQCNMVYWTSDDSTINGVAGNQVSDFKLSLDGNPATWYYLDIKNVKPEISVNSEYSSEMFLFYLDHEALESNEAFWTYWDAKLAEPLANHELWAYLMNYVLEGDAPMFMLKVTPTGQYMLVDYIQFMVDNYERFNNADYVYSALRINGDYPKGTYTFVGHSDSIDDYAIGINADNTIDYLDNPLSNVTLTITFR